MLRSEVTDALFLISFVLVGGGLHEYFSWTRPGESLDEFLINPTN